MILTPKELAARWACTVYHIYKLCREDKLPHFKVGDRIIRFRLSDIEKYECRNSSSTEGNDASTAGIPVGHQYGNPLAPQIIQRPNVGQPTFRPSSFFVPPPTSER